MQVIEATDVLKGLKELCQNPDKDLLIIDARGQALRCLLGGKDPDGLTDENGNNCNSAEFGVRNFLQYVLLPAIDEYGVHNIIMVWEGGNDRRRAIFPEYKSNRKEPSELVSQEIDRCLKYIKSLAAGLGILQCAAPTCEADDLIALFCEAVDRNIDIMTNDADLAQLIREYDNKVVTVIVGENVIADEYKGIPTHLIALYKSLVGDPSDGYPGIKGFGPKAWDSLVEEYGWDGLEELDRIVANQDFKALDDVEMNAALKKIHANTTQWWKSYILAKLHPEWVGKPFMGKTRPIQWFQRVPNKERVQSVLDAIGASEFMESLETVLPNYLLVDAEVYDAEFESELYKEIKKSPFIALDFETYDPEDPYGKEKRQNVDVLSHVATGASLTFGENLENTVYLTFRHKDSYNLDREVLTRIIEKANEYNIPIVAHSSQFELEILNHDFNVQPKVHYDTKHMAKFADENKSSGLKSLSFEWLNYKQKTFSETIGDKGHMANLTAEEAAFPYGCDDAIVTAMLYKLFTIILQVEGTLKFYQENIPAAQEVMLNSRRQGVYVSIPHLKEYEQDDNKEFEECMGKLKPLLAKHCAQGPKRAAVHRFLNADFVPYMQATITDPKALEEKIEKEAEAIISYCTYTDYEVHEEEPNWVPTPTKFSAACAKLGLPPVEKINVTYISEYIEGLTQDETIELTADQRKFLRLLGEAAASLRSRKGREYEALKKFCIKVTGMKGKLIETGTKIDLGSPKKMQWLLYVMLDLPVRVRSDVAYGSKRHTLGLEGSPATDAKAISAALAFDVKDGDWRKEALELIKKMKDINTRRSFYFKSYPELVSKKDGRMHPSFSLVSTVTRRPTCTEPNILQVSSGKDEFRLRKCFSGAYTEKVTGYDDTYLVVCIDFSQQELRILASECKDEKLIRCYVGDPDQRLDVHTLSTVSIYNKTHSKPITYEQAVKEMKEETELGKELSLIRKKKAKPVNFAIVYGGTEHTIALNQALPIEEAEQMYNAVVDEYAGITAWQERIATIAKREGMVKTAYGNIRHVTDDIFSEDQSRYSRMLRQAANSTIQGCAADILAIVLREMRDRKLLERTHSVLMAPVYDEIASLVPVSKVWEYVSEMVDIMEVTPPGHVVPMEADVSLGHTWGDQIELGVRPSKEEVEEAARKAAEEMKEYLNKIETFYKEQQ